MAPHGLTSAGALFYNPPAMAQGTNPDRMFDKRVVQRNIRTGRATKKDYESFVAALPDLSNQVRPAEDGGDDDGFDVRAAKVQARAVGVPRSPVGEGSGAAAAWPEAPAPSEPATMTPGPSFGSDISPASSPPTPEPSPAAPSEGSDPFTPRSDTD